MSGRLPMGRWDAVAIVVGIVVGVGIFRAPSEVAALVGAPWQLYAVWIAGAFAALVGAMCYAELSSAWPSGGGEYHFLKRAYGTRVGLLFVWARVTVIQTGAIAAVAFVFGDYAGQMVPLPPWLLAAVAVAGLTAVNLTGWRPGRMAQRVLTLLTVAAVAVLAAIGLLVEPQAQVAAATESSGASPSPGLAMVFVMLAYGGWTEAAYLSGDLRAGRNGMMVVLGCGLGLVAVLYVLLNAAYLSALGIDGMRAEDAVAAAAMRVTIGESGAVVLSAIVALAALSTLNATIITGSRAVTALGDDVPGLGALASWRNAVLAQGLWVLALVGAGILAHDGFAAMIEFTAPVFWLFLLLVGLALFVLRRKPAERANPFRVPFYPLTPLLFCASSAFMLHAAIDYVGASGWAGLALLAAGLPFCLWGARRISRASACAATTTGRDVRAPTLPASD